MLYSKVIDDFLCEKLQPYLTLKDQYANDELKETLRILQKYSESIKKHLTCNLKHSEKSASVLSAKKQITKCGLNLAEIQRYSRQLILPELRVSGQLKIKCSSVLIVGAGGLGCPAALYLAASGIGRLGIVDGDTVDTSNLHRQVAHKEVNVNKSKVDSLCQAVNELNSDVKTVPYKCLLSSANAIDIFNNDYDVILDATDNPATRYLINDACQLCEKPLVSGSALRWEGQLTVYNYPPGKGPTYRCLFPDPPKPDTVTNCSDGGVMGLVTGVIGCLQALEAIKIILNYKIKGDYSNETSNLPIMSGTMLLFDAISCRFRNVKLRPRREEANQIVERLIDYEVFCQSKMDDKSDDGSDSSKHHQRNRISVEDYRDFILDRPHILIDVRTEPEFEICSLDGSINIPLETIESNNSLDKVLKQIEKKTATNDLPQNKSSCSEIHIILVCRRGNDSQTAKNILEKQFGHESSVNQSLVKQKNNIKICDIIGGLEAWANRIDSTFAKY